MQVDKMKCQECLRFLQSPFLPFYLACKHVFCELCFHRLKSSDVFQKEDKYHLKLKCRVCAVKSLFNVDQNGNVLNHVAQTEWAVSGRKIMCVGCCASHLVKHGSSVSRCKKCSATPRQETNKILLKASEFKSLLLNKFERSARMYEIYRGMAEQRISSLRIILHKIQAEIFPRAERVFVDNASVLDPSITAASLERDASVDREEDAIMIDHVRLLTDRLYFFKRVQAQIDAFLVAYNERLETASLASQLDKIACELSQLLLSRHQKEKLASDLESSDFVFGYRLRSYCLKFEAQKKSLSTMSLGEVLDKFEELLAQDMLRVRIGVVGNSGVGKSSFINRVRACDDHMPECDLPAELLSASVNHLDQPDRPDYQIFRYIESQDCVDYVDFKGYGVYHSLEEYLACLAEAKCDLFVFIYASRLTRSDMELIKKISEQLQRRVFVAKSFIDLALQTASPQVELFERETAIREAKRQAELEKYQRVFEDLFGEPGFKLDDFKVYSISCRADPSHQLRYDLPELLEDIADALPLVSTPSNQITPAQTKATLRGFCEQIARFKANPRAGKKDLLKQLRLCQSTMTKMTQTSAPDLYFNCTLAILRVLETKIPQ